MPVDQVMAYELADLEDLLGQLDVVTDGEPSAQILLCEECLCTPERCYACCC